MAPTPPTVRTERALTRTGVFMGSLYVGYFWQLPDMAPSVAYGVVVDPAWRGRWHCYRWGGFWLPRDDAGFATEEDAVAALVAEVA